MPNSDPINRATTAAVIVALLVVIGVAAALFDLGPFANEAGLGPGAEGDLVARGDQICEQTQAKFDDQQGSQPKTAREAAQVTQNLLELSRSELEQIQALEPSPEMRKPLAKYVAAKKRGVELLEQGQKAAAADDYSAYSRYQAELAAGQLKRSRFAQVVGFEVCSAPSIGRKELSRQSRAPVDSSLSRPNKVNNPPPGTP